MPNTGNLVPIRDAARRLGVTYSTAYKYVTERNIPTVRVGGYRFVDPEAIRAVVPGYLQRGTRPACEDR